MFLTSKILQYCVETSFDKNIRSLIASPFPPQIYLDYCIVFSIALQSNFKQKPINQLRISMK